MFAERAMRPITIAIGRKNWLFVGSERAGHRANLASFRRNAPMCRQQTLPPDIHTLI